MAARASSTSTNATVQPASSIGPLSAGSPSIAKVAGDNQITLVSSDFTTLPRVLVTDASSVPIPGAQVTFTIVNGTARAVFSDGTTALTTALPAPDPNGRASPPALFAASTARHLTVTA